MPTWSLGWNEIGKKKKKKKKKKKGGKTKLEGEQELMKMMVGRRGNQRTKNAQLRQN